jgi:hypothetical protein
MKGKSFAGAHRYLSFHRSDLSSAFFLQKIISEGLPNLRTAFVRSHPFFFANLINVHKDNSMRDNNLERHTTATIMQLRKVAPQIRHKFFFCEGNEPIRRIYLRCAISFERGENSIKGEKKYCS